MSAPVGNLRAQLDLSAPGLGGQIKGVGSQFQQMRSELVSSVGQIHPALGTLARAMTGPAGLAAAGVGAATAVGVAFKRLMTESEEITSTADRLNMGTEFLERLQDVASRTGTSFGTVSSGWQKMQLEISRASGGGGRSSIFKQLGLDPETMRQQSPEASFRQLATAISAIENPVERARYQYELFGRSGVEMDAVLRQTADGLGHIDVVSEQSRRKMAELENSYLDLKRTAGVWWKEAMVFALGWMASGETEKRQEANAAQQQSIEEAIAAAEKLKAQEKERGTILEKLNEEILKLKTTEEERLLMQMKEAGGSDADLKQLRQAIAERDRLVADQKAEQEAAERIRAEEEKRLSVIQSLREEVERMKMGDAAFEIRGLSGAERQEAMALQQERERLRMMNQPAQFAGAAVRGSAEAYSAIVQAMRPDRQIHLQERQNQIAENGFNRVERAVRESRVDLATAAAPTN